MFLLFLYVFIIFICLLYYMIICFVCSYCVIRFILFVFHMFHIYYYYSNCVICVLMFVVFQYVFIFAMLFICVYSYLFHRRLGGACSAEAHQEIVSFRSCVRASDVAHNMSYKSERKYTVHRLWSWVCWLLESFIFDIRRNMLSSQKKKNNKKK